MKQINTMRTSPKVDGFFRKPKPWQDEVKALRAILLESLLVEDMKWGHPCYTFEGGNVVLIHAFKAYCALLFFKGALLKDPKKLLVQQTENVQSGRQLRFTGAEDIAKKRGMIRAYVDEAIEVEKSGVKIDKRKTSDFPMPEEFRAKLKSLPTLKSAFEALTPGRQRGYLLYFSSAKQAKTREARIEKSMKAIFEGKGLDD